MYYIKDPRGLGADKPSSHGLELLFLGLAQIAFVSLDIHAKYYCLYIIYVSRHSSFYSYMSTYGKATG